MVLTINIFTQSKRCSVLSLGFL